ncbi:MAG TPA: hypothetical protein VEC36_06930, partial [Patescibacteria group bacterium]|nr:hypothetical protein [Patescibacteria group bacterium]
MFTHVKRGIFLAVFCLIGVFCFSSSNALAQDPPPCLPDCYNDVFGSLDSLTITMMPCNELVKIKY